METRRFLYFDSLPVTSDKVKIGDGGKVMVPKNTFSEFVIEKMKEENHSKSYAVDFEKDSSNDNDLAKINEYSKKPLKAEDISVYKVNLANDIWDRDRERFTLELLKEFKESAPGKGVLIGHDTSSLPVGRIFDAKVVKIEETNWLQIKFYILSKNTDLIDNIDSGIYKDFSIGFSAWKIEPIYKGVGQNQTIEGWEWQKHPKIKGETREASLVYLGAQYGAGVSKSVNSGQSTKTVTSGLKLTEGNTKMTSLKLAISGRVVKFALPESEGQLDGEKLTDDIEKLVNDEIKTVTDKAKTEIDSANAEVTGVKTTLVNHVLAGMKLSGELEDKSEAVTAKETELNGKTVDELFKSVLFYSAKVATMKSQTLDGVKIEKVEDVVKEGKTVTIIVKD